MSKINSMLVTDGDGKVLDTYTYEIDSLGEKLGRKKAKRIEEEKDKRREEENKKRSEKLIFRAKKKKLKEFSPMVRKLLNPLAKALKRNYEVAYKFNKRPGCYYPDLHVYWGISAGPYYLQLSFGDKQEHFLLYLKDTSIGELESNKEYFGKADLTEESLKSEIYRVFVNYINSQEIARYV
jgi:hypothetical protein